MDATIKRRSFISTLSLFFQSGYSAVLGLIANLIVTILFKPATFGIYITVLSVISFLNYFSDVGLAASLIQKKELTKDDIKTTFTVQQIIIISLILFGFAMTNVVQNFYHFPQEGIYLYYSLLIGFFISSLKTIPSVFLERQIKFQKLVFVQVIENTVFYGLVSVLALMGMGLRSFTIAVIARAVIGLIIIYRISYWKPQIGISMQSLRQLLHFGLPFQASSFLALFKDDLIILYLGRVLGFEGLGYIGWAKKWSDAPIRIVMDNVSRVLFPLISKFQEDKEKLRRISEKILYYQTALIAPILVGMMLTVSQLIYIIPNYQKWQPALPIFYILAASSLILSFSAPFMNLYNALGRVKTTFTFMLILTIAAWLTVPTLTTMFSYYGFAIAHFIISCILGILLIKVRRLLHVRILRSIYKPLVSSALMAIAVILLQQVFSENHIASFAMSIFYGALIYIVCMTQIFKINIRHELATLSGREA